MPQCGLAPGFVSIVANHLTESFDSLDTVYMRVGALPQFPTNALMYNLTWSTDGLINEYCNPCEAIHEGRRSKSCRWKASSTSRSTACATRPSTRPADWARSATRSKAGARAELQDDSLPRPSRPDALPDRETAAVRPPRVAQGHSGKCRAGHVSRRGRRVLHRLGPAQGTVCAASATPARSTAKPSTAKPGAPSKSPPPRAFARWSTCTSSGTLSGTGLLRQEQVELERVPGQPVRPALSRVEDQQPLYRHRGRWRQRSRCRSMLDDALGTLGVNAAAAIGNRRPVAERPWRTTRRSLADRR